MSSRALVALTVLGLGCGDDDDDGSADAGQSLDAGAVGDAGSGDPGADASAEGDGSLACVATEERVPISGASHVIGEVAYPSLPPAGGDHAGCWGKWGVHESELADERFVHNLEHGGVVFLYRCPDGCPAEVEALRALVRGRDLALLTPYAALPTRFGVVSWGYRLLSDCFDLAALERFYAAHRNQGLEMVGSNPPASCD